MKGDTVDASLIRLDAPVTAALTATNHSCAFLKWTSLTRCLILMLFILSPAGSTASEKWSAIGAIRECHWGLTKMREEATDSFFPFARKRWLLVCVFVFVQLKLKCTLPNWATPRQLIKKTKRQRERLVRWLIVAGLSLQEGCLPELSADKHTVQRGRRTLHWRRD